MNARAYIGNLIRGSLEIVQMPPWLVIAGRAEASRAWLDGQPKGGFPHATSIRINLFNPLHKLF
jgi:hypothetical protein